MGNLPAKPVAPPFTEHNLPDQTGKVFLVTGATSGIGKELGRLLYGANARVWIAARSKSKAEQTIAEIQSKAPGSKGDLRILIIDFNDLRTIKPAVEDFLAEEDRLDVLFNNAGIMIPPQGTKTVQGYEAQLGVNNVAPFLFIRLLMPLLTQSADSAPPGSVRVVWVSSSAVNAFAPATGVEMDNLDYHNDKGQWFKYGTSKAGNVFHAAEFARRLSSSGIVNVVSGSSYMMMCRLATDVRTGLRSGKPRHKSVQGHARLSTFHCSNRSPEAARLWRIYRALLWSLDGS